MNKIILLDSNSLIHRAYHALPNLKNSKGQPTGAIYGFLNILLLLIKKEKPTHIAAAFDLKGPTFRHKKFEAYKGTRKPMDEELKLQFEPIKKLLRLMDIEIVEMQSYEADDILGTLSKKFKDNTIIVTGDKDSFQLASENTKILWTKRGVTDIVEITLEKLAEMGFTPDSFIDYKAMRGDTSDNIPGISGVGEKTAMNLLAQYKSLDGLYEHCDEIKGKIGEKIRNSKEIAYLSKELATIETNVPIECNLDCLSFCSTYSIKVKEYLQNLEMMSIISRMDIKDDEENNLTLAEKVEIMPVRRIEKMKELFYDKKEFSVLIGEKIQFAFDSTINYEVECSQDLFSNGPTFEEVFEFLKSQLNEKKLIAYDVKKIMHQSEIEISNFYDVMIAGHLSKGSIAIKSFEKYLQMENLQNIATSLFVMKERTENQIANLKMEKLLYEIEFPLAKVLYKMEKRGFSVKTEVLENLEALYTKRLSALSKEIHQLAGSDFNIGSPKQMSAVLFEDLGLKAGKKTKTGYSVSEDVLEKLKYSHPIIPLILEWRHLSKLNSTYVVSLKQGVENGKIHTDFNQSTTTTGRLSSTNPNLQNIPARAIEAKDIKSAFIGTDDNVLVSADYSQIELRLLAHLSNDQGLIEQYKHSDDIHAATASKIFGVESDEVTKNMRRDAKAVNFGIIYGMSDFGLATSLSISKIKAKEFINLYFEKYQAVKKYLDGNIEFAKQNGYAETMFGRRRTLNDITASNYLLRSSAERMALNTPLQGSAADIIKIAMIDVEEKLKNLKSKMILQVHDELIIDTFKDEIEEVKKIVKESMENAVELQVPLIADIEVGKNWGEME